MANKDKEVNTEEVKTDLAAASKPTETALATSEPEKKGLWTWIKERSVPVKIGLGVVAGAAVTGLVFVGKMVLDAFTAGGDETDDTCEACESESPQDE